MSGSRPAQAGFTIVELLIGLLVGSIAMSMVFGLFFRSTEAIRFGNSQAMAVGEVEVAMQRLVREIKGANTTNPHAITGEGILLPADLPLLPYNGFEPAPYLGFQSSSGGQPFPLIPAARLFAAQQGVLPLYRSAWCPNPNLVGPDDSNSLVYYLNQQGTIHRITLRADGTELVRLDQSPIIATTLSDQTPRPERRVIARGLRSIQFTYPKLLAELENGATGAAFATALPSSPTERDRYLNQHFRRLIGIRLRLETRAPGGARPAVSELRSTVEVRN